MFYRAALALALLVPAASAPALAETAEERLACTADAQLLCADEIPDRDRVYSCLVKKLHDILNPACKKIISASIAPPPPIARSRK